MSYLTQSRGVEYPNTGENSRLFFTLTPTHNDFLYFYKRYKHPLNLTFLLLISAQC